MTWTDECGDLRAAAYAQTQIDHHEQQLGRCVAGAREHGAPWSVIGEALGMTKQAAHKRFRDLPTPTPLPPEDDPEQLAIPLGEVGDGGHAE